MRTDVLGHVREIALGAYYSQRCVSDMQYVVVQRAATMDGLEADLGNKVALKTGSQGEVLHDSISPFRPAFSYIYQEKFYFFLLNM